MSLAAGSRLNSYEIIALLGAGGMGEVYRARDLTLKREVGSKFCRHIVRVSLNVCVDSNARRNLRQP
jgi:serine/threonine protein kinase